MNAIKGDNYTLYCGDCLDILPTLEAGSVDLTVTSPPYDNLRDYGKDFNPDAFNWRSIIEALYRVTKPGGVVVWVVADATINGSETGTSFRQALYAMECGFNLHDTMIYHRPGKPMYHNRYEQGFEYMFVWSRGTPIIFNPLTQARVYLRGPGGGGLTINTTNGEKHGFRVIGDKPVRKYNVWKLPAGGAGKSSSDNVAYIHPAIFPEALARDHILSWSNPGDMVLDPMMGAGTTGKMAMRHGRKFIGIDLEQEYIPIAHQRIANAAGDYMTTDREKEAGQMALWDIARYQASDETTG